MWEWLKQQGSNRGQTVNPEAPSPRPTARPARKYLSLFTYLEHRYANVVVLTFSQIEDLLGYPLPDLARSDPEWWTRVGTKAEPPLSEAWTMAGRTASPNLLAHTVMFERT